MKRNTPLTLLITCLWCWATLLPLRGIPLHVFLAGGGEPPTPGSPGTSDVIAWWELSDLNDDGPNGYTLTSVGSTSYETGIIGNAFVTNLSGEYAKITSAAWQVPGGAFTVTGWFKMSDVTPAAQTAFVTKYNTTGNQRSWGVMLQTTGVMRFQVSGDGAARIDADGSVALSDNTWYHFAAIYIPSTAMRVYVNGALHAEQTVSVPASIYVSTTDFNIGATANVSGYTGTRYMDEVALWDRALTVDEIGWLYNSGAGKTYSDL